MYACNCSYLFMAVQIDFVITDDERSVNFCRVSVGLGRAARDSVPQRKVCPD